MKKLHFVARVLFRCCAICVAMPIYGWGQFVINAPTFPASNTVQMTLSRAGVTNAYIIFCTSNVMTSFNSWTPVVTGAVGQTTFDLQLTTNANAFFRAGIAAPAVPTGLSATAGYSQVALSWAASVGAGGYNIKRTTVSNGTHEPIALGVTTTNYNDTGLTNGTTYYYVVSALNAGGESSNSSSVSATPSSQLTPITGSNINSILAGCTDVALASVGATDTANTFIVNYGPSQAINGIINGTANSWIPIDRNTNDVSPDWLIVDFHSTATLEVLVLTGQYANRAAGTYTFQYTTDPSPISTGSAWTTIGSYTWSSTAALPRTGFVIPAVANVTGIQLLSYRNPAFNNTYNAGGGVWNCWGNSIQELEAYAPAIQPPGTPTGLTAVGGNNQVTLNWTASSGATGYNVKQSLVSGGTYTNIANGVTATSYVNTGLSNGITYYYVVSATNAIGESTNSTEVYATPEPVLVPPGAAALGYTKLVIDQHPTAADISPYPAYNGPYKWFSGMWYQQQNNSYYSTTNGVLAITLGGTLSDTPLDFSSGALPVLPGTNGFYVEFDYWLSDNGSDHWPAVWLLPVEHGEGTDVYPGDPAGYERYMELDVQEGGFGPGLTGTVHNWTGIYPNYVNTQNPNNVDSIFINQSQKHTWGASYNPTNATVTWWVDGVQEMSATSPYVPAVAAQQHFYLIIDAASHGAQTPYTMYVSGVRAYVPSNSPLPPVP
jgi:hypothetical protein